ncbi:MAG: DUF1016 domain-containing protein [Richelia sp. RM2_1_2]|nr:DUF1016 domain-containing protein [Richelia sp. RM2_1_2]
MVIGIYETIKSIKIYEDNLIGQIEQDLRLAFPKLKGFSKVNLYYMRRL